METQMKYNEKYDLYLDDDFIIYYWDKNLDKLMQMPTRKDKDGYLLIKTKIGPKRIHRLIYETFVGPIPDGYEIDHVDTNKDNNGRYATPVTKAITAHIINPQDAPYKIHFLIFSFFFAPKFAAIKVIVEVQTASQQA